MQLSGSNQETVIVASVPPNPALCVCSGTVTLPENAVSDGVNSVVLTDPVGAAAVPAKSALRAAAVPLNDAVG